MCSFFRWIFFQSCRLTHGWILSVVITHAWFLSFVGYLLTTKCSRRRLYQELHLRSLSPACLYSLLYIKLKILKGTSLIYPKKLMSVFLGLLILTNSMASWFPDAQTRNWLAGVVLRFLSSPVLKQEICWLVLKSVLCNRRRIRLVTFRINQVLLQILFFLYSVFALGFLARYCTFAESDLFGHWHLGPDAMPSESSLPLTPFWLWPKGQSFLLRSERKRALAGNLLAPAFYIFHYFSAVSVAPCWLSDFLLNVSHLQRHKACQAMFSHETCHYLWFSSQVQDFAKESPVLPGRLWTKSLIFYLWAYFPIVPPGLCNFMNLLSFIKS